MSCSARPRRPACWRACAGRYRFRHALVREELAGRLPEETLRRTHAEAAALLVAADAPPEAVGASPRCAPAAHARPCRS